MSLFRLCETFELHGLLYPAINGWAIFDNRGFKVPFLERIIQASSNPGDLVLGPFCGCGTTIDAPKNAAATGSACLAVADHRHLCALARRTV